MCHLTYESQIYGKSYILSLIIDKNFFMALAYRLIWTIFAIPLNCYHLGGRRTVEMRYITLKLIVAVVACGLLLSGCKSSKGAAQRGGGKWRPQTSKIDYSKEYADPMGRDLADEARRWLGTPYKYGGQDRNGTDCSGLVMQLYRNVCAVKLPRTTTEQKSYCTEVARNKTRIGDLVFFGAGGGVSHVGLYIGKGEMIHASSSRGVMVSNIDSGYWGDRFRGSGRVDGAEQSWAANNRRRGKSKRREREQREVPIMEVPTVDRPLGVPSVSVSELASVLNGGGVTKQTQSVEPPAQSVPAQNATQNASVAQSEVEAIELLDLIINEKVDSIFSNRFMD